MMELGFMTYLVEPIMHGSVNMACRYFILILFCFVIIPLLMACEYAVIYYYNEILTKMHKSEDQKALLQRCGNPLLVLSREPDKYN